jgi:hypothetical protein
VEVFISAGEPSRKKAVLMAGKSLRKVGHLPMLPPMDIGQNMPIDIILTATFTMMHIEKSIFTLEETAGGCPFRCLRIYGCRLLITSPLKWIPIGRIPGSKSTSADILRER